MGTDANTLEQCPSWQAKRRSASQEIVRNLRTLWAYYHALQLVLIICQTDPVLHIVQKLRDVRYSFIIYESRHIHCTSRGGVIHVPGTMSIMCGNKMPTRCNRWFLLQILLLAQHVSGTTMPIIRSSRVLYKWLLPVVFGALVFKLSVWCGAEGYVPGLRARSPQTGHIHVEQAIRSAIKIICCI